MTETVEFLFPLGVKVQDRVTGFTGIVDMRAQYLNGCKRYSVTPPVDKKTGEMRDGRWVDEAQLELIDQGLNDKPVKQSDTGGPTERVKPGQRF
jgi:hypothetical protein